MMILLHEHVLVPHSFIGRPGCYRRVLRLVAMANGLVLANPDWT